MSEMLTVGEAASVLGVSQSTLADVVRGGKTPFPFERAGRRYLVPREGLEGVLEGRQASPLVRDALARVRREDEKAAADLARVARGDAARLWGAIGEAYAGSRLARAARSPERRPWERAHRVLLEAARLAGLPAPLSGGPAVMGSVEGGRGRRRAQRPRDWVSKTDMTRYIRCPYSFWLLDRGEISFEETIDEFQLRLLREGSEFERVVGSAATRIEVGSEEMPVLLRQEALLLGVPVFENPELGIRGQPDGIDAAGGALVPVEIKSHRDVQRTDELELAFYWLLLEPYRTASVREPRGCLILRRDGAPERLEVPIAAHRFDEVRRLVQEVRDARRRGVRPRICGCIVCSQLKREEVLRATLGRKDLTLIFGIGRKYAPALEAMGFATWEELLRCDPQAVADGMRRQSFCISTAEVGRWQRHAESWSTQAPVYFGDGPSPLGDSFIALDLEYDRGLIWLIGACLVEGDRREHVALWADDPGQEAHNLRELLALLTRHRDLPVLTWGGEGADVPRLRQAAARLGLAELTEALEASHCDLYQHARHSLRLPVSSLSLKEVAEFYGIPKISSIRDGRQAEMTYGEYRRAADKERKATLRGQLIDYNQDDLEALVGVAERLRVASR